MKIYLESLGCARNLVDSEVMLGKFKDAGYSIVKDPGQADIIVVNTCGFITPAAEESVDTIIELSEFKKTGNCKFIAVTGCLPQRFGETIAEELPEVDIFLGTGAYDKIITAVEEAVPESRCILPGHQTTYTEPDSLRVQTTPHMAYVKVAEGCNRKCTYCIIPELRGKQRSRRYEDIISEAETLIKNGTKEIILVAESTTDYGQDLDSTMGLAGVIKGVADISEHVWIRVLYGNPDTMTGEIIDAICDCPNVCNYFDLPIQHANSKILKRMGRPYSREDLERVFAQIRSKIPGAALRTTVIAGFPGETKEAFEGLTGFIENTGFDHLGAFVYSDSHDIPSHKLPDHVPEETAEDRRDIIMAGQTKISANINKKHLNKTYTVLLEENPEEGLFLGRTMFQAPEVDGITFVYGEDLETGTFVEVKITETYEYDLAGEAQ